MPKTSLDYVNWTTTSTYTDNESLAQLDEEKKNFFLHVYYLWKTYLLLFFIFYNWKPRIYCSKEIKLMDRNLISLTNKFAETFLGGCNKMQKSKHGILSMLVFTNYSG